MIIVYTIFLYFFSLYVIKKSIFFLSKYPLIDYPSDRSNHVSPTPKGAGISIIPIIILSTIFFLYLDGNLIINWVLIFSLCLLLATISLVDDIRNLSTKIRLISQFLIVTLSLLLFYDQIYLFINEVINSHGLSILHIIIILLFLISWVWIINLFNFMDGMDGLTALQMCSVAICTNILALMNHIGDEFRVLSLVIFTVYFAFYQFNKTPAKVFLGDVGSIPSGYIVGFILIINLFQSGMIIPLLIINMYYILDSSITLIIRIIKKQNIFKAHSLHFYQQVIRKGYSHNYVVKKIFGLNLVLLVLSIFAVKYPITSIIFSILFTSALLYSFYFKRKI